VYLRAIWGGPTPRRDLARGASEDPPPTLYMAGLRVNPAKRRSRDLEPPAVAADGAQTPPKAKVIRSMPPAGFEPATLGLEVRCSIRLSYGGQGAHDGQCAHRDRRCKLSIVAGT
jgi:hypothetical protein